MIHPINWKFIEIDFNFETDYDINILADLANLAHYSGCGALKFLQEEKIFSSVQQITDGIKARNVTKWKHGIANLKKRVINKFLPKLYPNSLQPSQIEVVNRLSGKAFLDYYFNLQNRYLWLKLMPTPVDDYTVKRNFILYDAESKERTGRGILGFISITSFNIYNEISAAAFKHRKLEYYVHPAYINWTCVYLPPEKKENIKRNLSFSKTSIAKYMTNSVCQTLLNEFESFYGLDVHGILLVSISYDYAKPAHLRNGKFLACHFLNEWENGYGDDLSEFLPIEDSHRQVFYMYTPDNVPFGPGNEMYDTLLADGSSLMYRLAGTKADDFNPDNFRCRSAHPYSVPLGGMYLQHLKDIIYNANAPPYYGPNYGGRRTRRRSRLH